MTNSSSTATLATSEASGS